MQFRKIIRNINLLNILLMSVIIMSISYSLLPLLDIKLKYTLPAAKKIVEQKEEKAAQTQTPSIAEYTMIAEENLFHPERKIPAEENAEEKALPQPDFVLYGTLITDDISLAYLEDLKAPQSSPGRGKRQTALRKGDAMSGYTLKDVEAEKIVMVRGEDRMIITLNDPSHPKERKETGITTASVQPQEKAPASQPAGVASAKIVSPASKKSEHKKRDRSSSKGSEREIYRSRVSRPLETGVSTSQSVSSNISSSSSSSSTSSRKYSTGPFGRSALIGK
jgi:hypothetical protein